MATFYIFKGANSQFYFKLVAGNGEKILKSEGYVYKWSCQNGIDSVKANAPYDSRYEKKKASNGQYFFNLTAANGQVIGTSETYVTESGRDNGIAVVKRDAPSAGTVDQTV